MDIDAECWRSRYAVSRSWRFCRGETAYIDTNFKLFSDHFSVSQHCDRFVDPALSFAVSWLYYFMWSVFLASGE